ncbi:copper-binding protein [Thiobacillus sp.]|uniref:copper-binding protein n=1 Tax=Thiobacillus sp. TaxID=924 RepID=UPI0039185DB8
MPGMTMVFQVKDSAILEKVKVGDKVKFVAEKSGGCACRDRYSARQLNRAKAIFALTDLPRLLLPAGRRRARQGFRRLHHEQPR